MAIPAVNLISASVTPVTLLASNPSRKEAIIQNNSTSPLYVSFGDTASPIRYSVKLYTDDAVTTAFRGSISGIWIAATGNVMVTELK